MDIRLAHSDDALTVAQIHVRSWQVGYRDLLPADYLHGLRAEDRAARYDLGNRDPSRPVTLVAVDGDDIWGFATIAQTDAPACGELAALYVSPEWWRSGVGSALVAAARQKLLAFGHREAVLWMLSGNTRAEKFYTRDGWVKDGGQRIVSLWGVTVEELRLRRDLGGSLSTAMGLPSRGAR
jgi:GNAT superfamily N-acetyltransferase